MNRMTIPINRLLVIQLAATTLLTLPARSEWVWAPAQMISAEELAASGALAPLPVPTKLSNFRYPFLQEDGSVIFIANDHLKPAGKEGREGVFKIEANDRVTSLTSAGEGFVNSPEKVAEVWGLRVAGGRAVFRATLESGQAGIALWESGRTYLLASSGTPEGWSEFGYPDISQNIVVFSAARQDTGKSLFVADLAGANHAPTAIVPSGAPMPDTDGLKFEHFSAQQAADGKDAVFRAYSDDYDWRGPKPRAAGAYRKEAFGKDAPKKIVDMQTQVPGAPAGKTFSYHLDSAVPRNGHTVIVNETDGLQGIYLASPDGKIALVADTNTAIPELFQGAFTGFSKWVSNCHPWILFVGAAADYIGIFALKADSEELYLLADSRMNFDGKKISGAEVSNAAKVGDKVALMLEFSDGSSGVYLATFGKGLAMSKAPAGSGKRLSLN